MRATEVESGLELEMVGADFGDARLSSRLTKVISGLMAGPDRSFPSLFDDASLEGAYRFFNNDGVTPERILQPHIEATIARMAGESTSLIVHDTSTMSFDPSDAREGLGRVRSAGQAFFAHVSLALSGDGSRLPLGVVGLATHTRHGPKKKRGHSKPDVSREFDRWGLQVSATASLNGVDRTRIVHLMDREGDDFALFAQLVGSKDRFVIRLAHDRLLDPNESGGANKLAQAVTKIVMVAEREVALTQRPVGERSPKQLRIHPAREGRMAKLAFGATKVALRRPQTQSKQLPETLDLHVVRVWELDAPQGNPPVEWLLLTTEPIDTAAQILTIVDWYRARWVIEEFFKAIKTGCAYGKRQFETYDALLNVLATFMPIAWRLLRMRAQARAAPDAAATTVLSSTMIVVLHKFTRIKLRPCPSAREVLLAVAALGGHQKHNGEPGWLTLARGYEKLQTLTEGWAAASDDNWTDV
jgi:Transposase DNA-binding/Transposase DDE domain